MNQNDSLSYIEMNIIIILVRTNGIELNLTLILIVHNVLLMTHNLLPNSNEGKVYESSGLINDFHFIGHQKLLQGLSKKCFGLTKSKGIMK